MPVKLMKSMKKAREVNELLMNEYVRMGDICHRKGDFEGRDYWNERYYQIVCENEKLDMDIRKLKQELI